MKPGRCGRGESATCPYIVYSHGQQITDGILLERFETEEVGIFETLRTYCGKIFREREHLKRFLESAKTVTIGITDQNVGAIRESSLQRELRSALKSFWGSRDTKQDVFIRMTLVGDEVFVMIGGRHHPGRLYQKGVALSTSPVRRSLSNASAPEVKTSSYQNAVFASLEPRGEKKYECLFLDRNGFVTEVRIGNLFLVKYRNLGAVPCPSSSRRGEPPLLQLLTPPTLGILNGVTRRFVIECASQAKIPVKETPLTRHDVFNADEAFLTNTSWEILPVAEVDRRKIGKQVPGPVTVKLHRIFKHKVMQESS